MWTRACCFRTSLSRDRMILASDGRGAFMGVAGVWAAAAPSSDDGSFKPGRKKLLVQC